MTRPTVGEFVVPGGDRRQYCDLFSAGLDLESGRSLSSVTVAFESWGTLNAQRDNAILVLHALTGDAHASSDPTLEGDRPGWWEGIIGPGAPIDTERFFVVCPNALGGCSGTTGPSSPGSDGRPYGSRFPLITIRDQVTVEAALADALGIERWFSVIGGSMGGMRVLEWAVMFPERVARGVVLAVGAQATAYQIALCNLQIRAIELDPDFLGGDYYGSGRSPIAGLGIARGIGQLTYRTPEEFEERFARSPQSSTPTIDGGEFTIESYLRYQGEKLGARFDANSYLVLSRAMNLHDLTRNRGPLGEVLQRITATITVAGILSDRLYPIELQEELVAHLPHAAPLRRLSSFSGHDGFLLEVTQVAALIAEALLPSDGGA